MGRERDENMTPDEFERAFKGGAPATPTGHPKVVVRDDVMPLASSGIADRTRSGATGQLDFPRPAPAAAPGSRLVDQAARVPVA